MYALDTNVMIRYVLADDKEQTKRANAAIERLSVDNQGFISCVVLCEISWVLTKAYKVSKGDCIAVLRQILTIAVFDIERLSQCLQALRHYEQGKADFSDYLIQQIAEDEGYHILLTFDKNALKSHGFQKP